jgi:hypothetical protein
VGAVDAKGDKLDWIIDILLFAVDVDYHVVGVVVVVVGEVVVVVVGAPVVVNASSGTISHPAPLIFQTSIMQVDPPFSYIHSSSG